jgi:hypothetical protein
MSNNTDINVENLSADIIKNLALQGKEVKITLPVTKYINNHEEYPKEVILAGLAYGIFKTKPGGISNAKKLEVDAYRKKIFDRWTETLANASQDMVKKEGETFTSQPSTDTTEIQGSSTVINVSMAYLPVIENAINSIEKGVGNIRMAMDKGASSYIQDKIPKNSYDEKHTNVNLFGEKIKIDEIPDSKKRIFNPPQGTKRLLINLPEDLHTKVMNIARRDRTTATNIMIQLIKNLK